MGPSYRAHARLEHSVWWHHTHRPQTFGAGRWWPTVAAAAALCAATRALDHKRAPIELGARKERFSSAVGWPASSAGWLSLLAGSRSAHPISGRSVLEWQPSIRCRPNWSADTVAGVVSRRRLQQQRHGVVAVPAQQPQLAPCSRPCPRAAPLRTHAHGPCPKSSC
jgi:hypothetical protein